MSVYSLCFAIFLLSCCAASPKDRVINEEPLSKEEHWRKTGDGENEHNPEYDHEAFLGKDEAREYEGLSPEESQKRLG